MRRGDCHLFSMFLPLSPQGNAKLTAWSGCRGLVCCRKSPYNNSMNQQVLCKPSAFKHGITLDQILHVLDDPRYEGPVEVYENKYLVLGFDPAGNLLEIMYNEMEGGGVSVFHAMPCRSIFFPLLPNG